MAYSPQTWTDSPSTATPINASRLTTMENGIAAAAATADAATRLINITAAPYGASPGGTAAANTTAIQAAITAATTAGTGIYVPPGIYTHNALTISAAIEIAGAGWDSVLKLANSANAYQITFPSTTDPGIRGAYIHDLKFDCNGLSQTGASGGINARSAIQCFFERLYFTAPYSVGLRLDGMSDGTFGHHNRVYACLFDNSGGVGGDGQGLLLTSTDENFIVACDFEYLGGNGTEPRMVKDWSGLNYHIACNFVGGTNNCEGIRLQDCNRSRIVGCVFDGVSGSNVAISGTKHLVESCTFTFVGDQGSVAASGVLVDFGAIDCIISGNVFESSTTAGKTRSFIRETGSGGGGNNLITNNSFAAGAVLTVGKVEIGGTGSIVRGNRGYVTEAKGTATVASGTTSIAVTHGLDRTPAAADVKVTPTNSLGSAAKFWTSAVGATTFTINTNVDPGATTATFAWQAQVL